VSSVALAGRVDVTSRALDRVITAIAASELEVKATDVSVTLTDEQGRLGVAVAAPIRVAPLADLEASGFRLLDRGQRARSSIRAEVERIAGREVGTVSVRFSAAIVSKPRRVS
jgi:hypothetical protein